MKKITMMMLALMFSWGMTLQADSPFDGAVEIKPKEIGVIHNDSLAYTLGKVDRFIERTGVPKEILVESGLFDILIRRHTVKYFHKNFNVPKKTSRKICNAVLLGEGLYFLRKIESEFNDDLIEAVTGSTSAQETIAKIRQLKKDYRRQAFGQSYRRIFIQAEVAEKSAEFWYARATAQDLFPVDAEGNPLPDGPAQRRGRFPWKTILADAFGAVIGGVVGSSWGPVGAAIGAGVGAAVNSAKFS